MGSPGSGSQEDGLVRWRLADLKRRIFERFFVLLDERSVSRLLKSMKFTHVSVRPRNPKADADAQEAHKKRMARPVGKRFLQSDLSSLRQRIRPVGVTLAKMEIRAPWSS